MARPEVPVTPATLRWARKTASASEQEAAERAGVDLARLQAWEAGTEKPTVPQLRRLADLYKRPFAFFLLDQLPRDFTVMRSFRRLPDSEDLALSLQLAVQLRQALQRREIALELSSEIGEQPTPFRPKASANDDPVKVAASFRQTLGLAVATQLGWRNDYEAFRAWRQALERVGALTFQVSKVDVHEMRGVALYHSVLPVVLLNSADAVRGRIFTLAHEAAHLLLRSSATKDSDSMLDAYDGSEEVWCNRFAGALLVPPASFTWAPEHTDPDLFDWGELSTQANQFKVSREVILRRLQVEGRLAPKQYQALVKALRQKYPPKAAVGGPVAQDVKVVSKLGIPFVRTVVAAYRQNKITLSDVADYLDVRVKYLPQIEERVLRGEYEAENGAEA